METMKNYEKLCTAGNTLSTAINTKKCHLALIENVPEVHS